MKTIKSVIILLFASLVLNGCKNFFEMERPPQFPWNSVSELEFAAVSPYNALFWGGWGALQSTHLFNQVLLSDYFKWFGNVESYSTGQIYGRRFDDRISEIEGMYSNLYKAIGLCNNGLDFFASTNDDPFPYASEEDKELNVKRIKGELLFMRAYSYYYLVTTFCPPYGYGNDDLKILVLRDHLSLSSDDAMDNTPVETSRIYDLIVSDLKEAKKLLPKDWETGMHNSYKSRGRANYWAATALLSQVYFTMQKFTGEESALTELDEIIEKGGYTLEPECFTNYTNESTSPQSSENSEVIMWMFFADELRSTTMHNSLRLTMFNKAHRDAQKGGNGNTSTGRAPTWSFNNSWIQMCLAKGALQEMGWMNADGSETAEARYDKRYYYDPNSSATIVNEQGLFYRFEGCDPEQAGTKRKGASNDGKYITEGKYSAYIGKADPVVLVNKYFRSENGRLQNQPLFRLAELYLNRAVIRKRAGIAGWADDYNKVASRAWNETVAGQPYTEKADADVSERDILVERWKEMAGEDNWYINYCAALGYEIGLADRTAEEGTKVIAPPYSDAYWKNCIPLGETDFQK